jgi:putative redox protein
MTQASVTLLEGMRFTVETGSGHSLIIDSHADVGGTDAGPRPLELMTASIAGCTAMDVISILRKMQQRVTALEVRVRTQDAAEHPRRFLEVHIEYLVTGHDLSAERVRRAIELSETKYCPALATVRPGTTIHTSYKILAAMPGAALK